MPSLNKVMLIGNLGKDPKSIQTKTGNQVSSFSMATSEKYKDKQTGEMKKETQWHNILVVGFAAEFANKYLKKGDCCWVEGKIKMDKYTSDGVEKIGVSIICSKVQSLSGKSQANGNVAQTTSQAYSNKDTDDFNDDIPF